jgi:predicted DNA binding protein
MFEVELSITPQRAWIYNISPKYRAVVKILDCKPVKRSGAVQELFEILVPEDQVEAVLKELKSDPSIRGLEVIDVKDGRITGSLISHTCSACRVLASSGCFLISSTLNRDGTITWLMLGNKSSIKRMLNQLERQGVKFALKKIERARTQHLLTKRQEEVLLSAYELGYFDQPRRIDLHSLASKLKMSPPTLSELLRRAQKKVITEYIKSKQAQLSIK